MDVKSAISEAGKSVIRAMGPLADEGEQDILDTLKAEHTEIKGLLAELMDAETPSQRRSLVTQITAALVPHSKAEERVLYTALIRLRDKDAQLDGHEGSIEHELASRTLHKLGGIANAASPEHRATAKVLKELVEHHIREEESNVWRDTRKHFSQEERVALNQRYLALKARVAVL